VLGEMMDNECDAMHGSYSGHSRGSIARSQCGSRNALFFSAPTKEMCMTCRIEDARDGATRKGRGMHVACSAYAVLCRSQAHLSTVNS
jgi:hypothetical protein